MMNQTNNDSDIVVKVALSRPQDAILECRKRLILDMSGQGGGKTATIAFCTGQMISLFPPISGFIAANTGKQLSSSTLKGVFSAWKTIFGWSQYHPISNPAGDYIVDKQPPLHFHKFDTFKDYQDIISFRDGTTVFVGSLTNYKAHDGKEFGWAHLDETKDTKEEALTDVILGRLRQIGLWFDDYGDLYYEPDVVRAKQRGLTAWNPCYLHTSPAMGVADWIIDMFQLKNYEDQIREKCYMRDKDFFHLETKEKAVIIYSSFHNARNLPPNYLENQLGTLKPSKADKLIYGIPFAKTGGEYYPSFERREHVGVVSYIPQARVHVTFDFNSSPYMTMLCCQVQYVTKYIDAAKNKFFDYMPGTTAIEVLQIRLYKEYCLESPRNSTEACCQAFDEDHREEEPDIYYYGDASGLSKIAGLGSLTNFKIVERELKRYIHNTSKRVKMPNVNPLKRRDLIDAIFAGTYPEVEIIISEDCPVTIKDFEKLKEGKDGKLKTVVKNKETGQSFQELGHTSDAFEYFVSELLKDYIKKIV